MQQFLHSTYLAAAEAGRWDRAALETNPDRLRQPLGRDPYDRIPPRGGPAGVKLALFHAHPSEEAAMGDTPGIDVSVPPSGTGCVECEADGGWWLHLRRCAQCGHIGCCDNSPSQHATAHARSKRHPVIRSFEPGEDWFWDYRQSTYFDGPELAPPAHHPADQTVPGPASRVPGDWQEQLR